MSFLSNSPKNKVYLSVTPGVGIEMIQLDLSSGKVANYSVRELAYDEQQKQIVDKEAFKKAVMEMYEELGISPKTQVVVNMPVVSFGISRDFALILPPDAITGGLGSLVEEKEYIFKRQEPLVSWLDAPSASGMATGKETRTILYTAIQKPVVEMLQTALYEIGSTLVGVENSLSSTFRALDYMNVTTAQMQPNMTWNLLLINSNGYTIVSMSGKNVIEYYEEPLAIKSFEGNEIYDAIVQSAKIALTSYPANYLYVISNTDQVSAELIIAKLKPSCSVDFMENNSFKKQDSLIPVSLSVLPNYHAKVSLQAIGAALADVSDFPLKFSLMDEKMVAEASCVIPIGEHEYVVTQKQAYIVVGIVAAIVLGFLVVLTWFIIPGMERSKKAKIEDYNVKNQEMVTEIGSHNKKPDAIENFDANTEVQNGVKNNRSKLMNYAAAGEAIPNNVWLTYFMTQGNGYVDIKGGSTDVNAVYVYFKNLRDSLIGSNLKLQKLEMDSNSVDAAVADSGANYIFEITNMSESQLEKLENSNPEGEEGDSEGGESTSSDSQPDNTDNGLLSPKPIQ